MTLGGTGKVVGDRHPKIANNVLIGAGASILGNITVGNGAQVAAGSLVLKPLEPHPMVAGSPAQHVGAVIGNPAASLNQWSEDGLNPEAEALREDLHRSVLTRSGGSVCLCWLPLPLPPPWGAAGGVLSCAQLPSQPESPVPSMAPIV